MCSFHKWKQTLYNDCERIQQSKRSSTHCGCFSFTCGDRVYKCWLSGKIPFVNFIKVFFSLTKSCISTISHFHEKKTTTNCMDIT